MLAFPPASDRGVTLPSIEASRVFPQVSKKTWFAVYTAPRHEKFVQAQLTAKQVQSFLPVYLGRAAMEEWGSTGDPTPALPGIRFCLSRQQ